MGRDAKGMMRTRTQFAIVTIAFAMIAIFAARASAQERTELFHVDFIGSPASPEVVLYGENFGSKPAPEPVSGTNNLGLCGATGDDGFDYGLALWQDDHTQRWSAGRTPDWNDCIGLKIRKYTDEKIVYTFGSLYTRAFGVTDRIGGVYGLYEGDSVTFYVNDASFTTTVDYEAYTAREARRNRSRWLAPRHPRRQLRLNLHAHG